MDALKERLPPHQALAAVGKWPLVGERAPRQDDGPWRLSVGGLVGKAQDWSMEELRSVFVEQERVLDIHCVTRWSRLDVRFGGIALRDILAVVRPRAEARFVRFVARSAYGHHTSLPLEDALAFDVLVAFTHEGEPLSSEHGGPIRTVVPARYFYKSLKWLEHIELLAEDRLGTWEGESGYHNEADPWKEQRYITPSLDRKLLARLLAAKDFSDQEILSLQAAKMSLVGLQAQRAKLRNADFRGAMLEGACFAQANLSNAHLQGADLAGADFRGADVEGANFCGADLRGADLRGASLFGVSFAPESHEVESIASARIDGTTRIDEASIAQLTPTQQAFVQAALVLREG
jgi:DMSO/TMAO reductase YedYZ molybdopterin-dependent catalytic subunit